MKIKIAKDNKMSNYKMLIKNIKYEEEILYFIQNNNMQIKKTEYLKNFCIYKLINIDKTFIESLKDKFEDKIIEISPMSVYSLPIRIDPEKGGVIKKLKEDKKYVTLGVIDNGVAKNKQLSDFIIGVDNPYKIENTSYNHGTFVSGIALYGDELEKKEIVKNSLFNIFDATVLDKTTIEEDDLLKNIFNVIVKYHKKVKIWNLSLSVKLEIEENFFSSFAVVLDYLQKEYNVLICKSAGNGGNFMKKLPKGKLYHGSDSLMSLVCASVTNDGNASSYSRIGLGVLNTIKPDLASYGGDLSLEEDGSMGMQGVFSLDKDSNIVSSSGTSFANARIASLCTSIYQETCRNFENFSDFDANFIKALIIHSTFYANKNLTIEEVGFGVPKDTKTILSYLKNENIKIIKDSMKENYKIDLKNIFSELPTKIKVTLSYDTDFDYFQNEKYILSDIKIKNYSENGVNLIRKFESNLNDNILELFSENDILKNFVIVIEKI